MNIGDKVKVVNVVHDYHENEMPLAIGSIGNIKKISGLAMNPIHPDIEIEVDSVIWSVNHLDIELMEA